MRDGEMVRVDMEKPKWASGDDAAVSMPEHNDNCETDFKGDLTGPEGASLGHPCDQADGFFE